MGRAAHPTGHPQGHGQGQWLLKWVGSQLLHQEGHLRVQVQALWLPGTGNQAWESAHLFMTSERPTSELRASMGWQGVLAKGYSQSGDPAPEVRRSGPEGLDRRWGLVGVQVRGQLPALRTLGSTAPLGASVYPSRCVLGTGEMREAVLSKVGDGETKLGASPAWPIAHGNCTL